MCNFHILLAVEVVVSSLLTSLEGGGKCAASGNYYIIGTRSINGCSAVGYRNSLIGVCKKSSKACKIFKGTEKFFNNSFEKRKNN